jgi:hypothetical protein
VREHIAFRDYAHYGVSPNDPVVFVEPHPRTRSSFAEAFGVSPEEQLRLEGVLLNAPVAPFDARYEQVEGVCSFGDAPPGFGEGWADGLVG